jgi:uncharacterized integral membrane protein
MNKREDNIYFAKVFGGAALLIALLFLIFFLVGCTTQKKAVKYFNKHELVGADYCSVKHPCKDSVHESLRYVIGEPVVTVHDSIIYDTATNTVQKVVVKYITKSILQVDTVYKDKVVYQTDKAQITVINEQLTQSKQQAANAAKSAKKWRTWAAYTSISLLLLVLAIALYIYIKNKR